MMITYIFIPTNLFKKNSYKLAGGVFNFPALKPAFTQLPTVDCQLQNCLQFIPFGKILKCGNFCGGKGFPALGVGFV